ncbi:hypothetical protein KR084_011857 [Drosophila pseudotakahashii]|nr:hypothetical protein KR084_011857 [Drosophila pseudotakahashii]
MDGGGDNQLAVPLFLRQREAFPFYADEPADILQVPDPDQADAVLQMAIHALILAELAEDSGFESGSESD